MQDYVVGVDGCRSGWLVCRYQPSAVHVSFGVYPNFSQILEQEAGAKVIAVDIPIGLTDNGRPRRCDLEARHLLSGARASSVFPAPARCLLAERDYFAVCRRSRELYGKAVSQQAFAIFGKIAEVDALLNSELQKRVYEVHPEVCFWGVARRPMQHRKKTREGYDERRTFLCAALPCSVPARDQVRQLGLRVEPDDLLDAAVAALTAHRIYLGTAERIPAGPEVDCKGLRMEMVY